MSSQNPSSADSRPSEQQHGQSLMIETRLSLEPSRPLPFVAPASVIARRTLGILLLMITVVLWTASNFLASFIFADNTYSKPYFVTYINTSFFAISLVPIFLNIAHKQGYSSLRNAFSRSCQGYSRAPQEDAPKSMDAEERSESSAHLLGTDEEGLPHPNISDKAEIEPILTVYETAKLSLEFCLLWFIANYLIAACLQYTTVASSTILTSTSSIWTLVFGTMFRVEKFSARKLIGVLASLTGIVLISMVDLSSDNEDNRGDFPYKSQGEIALGDTMAFLSAVMYGIYAVVMKKRIGNEDRVNMPLFFGLVGLFNVLLLWPGFVVLHFTGVETFELPPTGKVWSIVLINSISSLVSDFCWAYAMLLTTPLVVTVGLSLTIPLSLIGQIMLSSQYSSAMYWVGAGVVLLSFLFINHEAQQDDGKRGERGEISGGGVI